jgi:hypothetical protein
LWGYPSGNLGFFRLNCIPRPADAKNLWDIPNLLLQKFPAPEFTATVKITFDARFNGEEAGMVVMGLDYGRLTIRQENGKLIILSAACQQADKVSNEIITPGQVPESNTVYFRLKVLNGGECQFFFSNDGKTYTEQGTSFKAREGKWISAKIGLYALRDGFINDAGSADIDWFRIEK